MNHPPTRPDVPPTAVLPKEAMASGAQAHDALPAGTRFGEFEILRVLGVGGFGIVYLAQDHSLERRVALKEYMPAALAVRGAGALITVRSESHTETYAMGLRSFINEARLLARFDHASLVKVYRFWEDNATAYMVMPYLQGTTLRDVRRSMDTAPTEAWMRHVLDAMLDALEHLHREGVYHRDIAPDNILIPPDGAPILLDFGAARHVISDRTQSLTAILKPSYAPIEQYADMADMRQGPWTDLYALGAVMHALLFGAPPAPATARALQSDAGHIARRSVPGISAEFIGVVAWMLGVRPDQRPQSVAAVRAALAGEIEVPSASNEPTTVPGFAALAPATAGWADPSTVRGAMAGGSDDPTVVEPRAHPALRTTVPQVARQRSAGGVTDPEAEAEAKGTTERKAKAKVRTTAKPKATAPPHRPRWVLAGAFAAFGIGVLVLWQFIALVAAPRAPLPGFAAAAHPTSAVDAASAASAPTVAGNPALPTLPAAAQGSAIDDALLPAVSAASTHDSVAISAPMTSVSATALSTTPSAASPASTVPAASASATRARPKPPVMRYASASSPVYDLPVPHVAIHPPAQTAPQRPMSASSARPPATAREACGDRNFFSMAICLNSQCEDPRFRDGAECMRMLDARRRREDR